MIDDIDRIMAVMTVAFDPVYGEAWNRRQVEDALSLGNSHYCVLNAAGAAPENGEPAAGFFLSRTGYQEEELLLIGVDPGFRRAGLGRALLERFRTGAANRGAQRLLLEMRRGNPAETLYQNFGFHRIGERREYYRTPSGNRLDALTFACDISESEHTFTQG